MTPQELKNSILQLAVQGKLVEQRAEEGTAEELYKKIQAEKQKLTAEKKIKKEKPLPEITAEEIPFDIPDSWKWVRLGEVVQLNPKNSIDDEMTTSFIPMKLIDDGYRNNCSYEIKKWGDIKKGFTHFADGDIGVAKITPCFQNRKSVIFKELENGYGAGTTEVSVLRILNQTLEASYILWFLKSDYFIKNGIKSFTGTAGQQRIHKDYLSNCVFPLPPLEEQKRIVAKIEELLPQIDRYEKAWSKLEEFNKRFPADMQKSILQYAVQGKLVEQRAEEGTAEELYKKIQAEKQKLIAEKKIKKEKTLPEITAEEIPFEIPESWKWVRLGEVVQLNVNDNNKFIQKFEKYMMNKQYNMERNGKLMSLVGVEKVFEKVKKLNAQQISEFWTGFSYVYRRDIGNLNEFYHADKDFFKELKEKIEKELLTDKKKAITQKLHLEWFCNYLKEISEKL